MSKLLLRSSIALATVSAVLLTSRPADAQVFAPSAHRPHGGLLYNLGAWPGVEKTNQAMAERRLPHAYEKLNRDVARNDMAAADHDARVIRNLQHRIAVDEWLIRKMSCREPGYYPYPRAIDPESFRAIAQYRCPPAPIGVP